MGKLTALSSNTREKNCKQCKREVSGYYCHKKGCKEIHLHFPCTFESHHPLTILQEKMRSEFEKISSSSGDWCSCFEGDLGDYFPKTQKKALDLLSQAIATAYEQGWADAEKNTAEVIGKINGVHYKLLSDLQHKRK